MGTGSWHPRGMASPPTPLHISIAPAFSSYDRGTRLGNVLTVPPLSDVDNRNPSPLPDQRVHPREINPMARRRILRIHSRYPALESRQRVPNLRDRGLGRENRFLRQRARCYSRYVSRRKVMDWTEEVS